MAMEDIKLKIQLQGGDEEDIEAPPDISGDDFLKEIVSVLALPTTDAGGHRIAYRLDNKSTGRSVDGLRSLSQNGVRQGHYLRLIRDVVAGATDHMRDASWT